jgi:ABC-type phosphate/phosphonate transport system substrate-binding protein
MYDWPEIAGATDALWHAIARRLNAAGIAAPETLDRTRRAEDVWRDPGLVLSQTCGFPYATRLSDAVRLVAAPVYDVEGCEGPRYSSMLVARRDDAPASVAACADLRFARNASDSLSGYVALRVEMRAAGLDSQAVRWVETGSHRASLKAVAEGRADVAAIDCICMALARAHEPDAVARLTVFAQTPLRPALPFITAAGRSEAEIATLRAALSDALASSETAEARDALNLVGAEAATAADYAPLASLMSAD